MDISSVCFIKVDYIIQIDKELKVRDKISIRSIGKHVGSSAANTVLNMAKLGKKTGIISPIGTDENASIISSYLKEYGIDTRGLKVIDGESAVAYVIVDPSGNRVNLTFDGAGASFGPEDIDEAYVSKQKILHIGRVDLEVAERAAKLARKHGVMLSLSLGREYARGWEKLQSIMEGADFVFMNDIELSQLNIDIKMLSKHVKTIVMTKKEKGCEVVTRGETISVPTVPLKAVDATGAGDAFAAGFLYGILESLPLRKCAEIGNYCGGKAILKVGATTGTPTLAELKRDLSL